MLQHQQPQLHNYIEDEEDIASTTSLGIVEPSNIALDEFKRDVKLWIELDNSIKQLKKMAKEKVKLQKGLTENIMTFMGKYRIEDLNTKEGKLRYKMIKVKPPAPRQPVIKERLQSVLKDDPELCKSVMDQVFPENETKPNEAPKLKRLKGTRKALNVS
jgi:hypothetical protein